ncbi:MAG: hypothetical protein WDW38_005155 [Sanguina aurantia]
MSLSPWIGMDPFSALERAIDRSIRSNDRSFDLTPMLRSGGAAGGDMGAMTVAPWASLGGSGHPVDIMELDNRFEVHADAPGFTTDDISIETNDGVLTINGHKKEVHEEKGSQGQTWRRERVERRFTRSFALPVSAEQDNIEAHLDNGVLTVTVPKRPESVSKTEPKRISVKSGSATPSTHAIASHTSTHNNDAGHGKATTGTNKGAGAGAAMQDTRNAEKA